MKRCALVAALFLVALRGVPAAADAPTDPVRVTMTGGAVEVPTAAPNRHLNYVVTMTGTVAEVIDPAGDVAVSVGDTWTVVYWVEPLWAQDDAPTDPHRGVYRAIARISLQIGSCPPLELGSGTIPGSITVSNNTDLGDGYEVVADLPVDPTSPCPFADAPIDPVHLAVALWDSSFTVWRSDALPTTLHHWDFDTRSFTLASPGAGIEIRGGVAWITMEPVGFLVPTVSAWGLVILALLLLTGAYLKLPRTPQERA